MLHTADTFIQKTKKLYMDTRTQRNLAKLTDELSEVRITHRHPLLNGGSKSVPSGARHHTATRCGSRGPLSPTPPQTPPSPL